MRTAADIGMAGGAIALALAKYLVFTGALPPEATKTILADAKERLTDFPDGAEAIHMLEEMYERVVKEIEYF